MLSITAALTLAADRRPSSAAPPRRQDSASTRDERDRRRRAWTAPLTDALVRSRRFFTKGTVSDDLRTLTQGRRPRGRRLLPRPVEPRQGRPLHPRRELHRLLLVEGLRQGRDHHLGDPADRLPLGRPGLPGVRAPRLPPRRGLLLVHLLADPGPLPLRPRRAAADVPRGQGPARRRPGPRLGAHRREPAAGQGLQVRPRQGRPGPRHLGRGQPRSSPPPTSTRSRSTAPTGSPASRRSRRCRWSRTPPAPGS